MCSMKKGNEFNVIVVDWGPLAASNAPFQIITYPRAVANVPTVGEEVAKLVKFLIDADVVELPDVHLLGFSLGGHVAGIAGHHFKEIAGKSLARITGFDPAGPGFILAGLPRRIDGDDAEFVDCVHSNGGKLGTEHECGHVDFYPNGGRDQPNCNDFWGTAHTFRI